MKILSRLTTDTKLQLRLKLSPGYQITFGGTRLVPSPSAFSKFVLSTLKFFKHTQFLKYPQNNFGILKSEILLHKLAHLSIPKTF